MDLLLREADLLVERLQAGRELDQLALGGGTPTFLFPDDMARLIDGLRARWPFTKTGDISIEVDPRTIDAGRLDTLAELGFNRLSFGVQDFDPAVQKAVHRVQPAEQVFELVAAARERGFDSVNVDLIYGLPLQTPESFARTLQLITQLRPDRVAL